MLGGMGRLMSAGTIAVLGGRQEKDRASGEQTGMLRQEISVTHSSFGAIHDDTLSL